ncbi:MAG: hypothetical protein ACI4TH_09705, partial [Candidatus Ornithomonoglobus sp.]
MSKTKKAKPKRLLSLFLALVMVLGMIPTMSLTVSAAIVSSVNFTVTEPIGRENPNFILECDSYRVNYTNVQWYKGATGSGSTLDADDVFEENKEYTLSFFITLVSGNRFSSSFTVKVNGNAATVEASADMTGYYRVTYVFTAKDDCYAFVPPNVTTGHWIDVATDGMTDEEMYLQLKNMLERGGIYAIRLQNDIDFRNDDKDMTIVINGTKYLDLNGHDILFRKDHGSEDTMFEVSEIGNMTLVDSVGGAELRYDGYIGVEYDTTDERNVFDVYGKLTVNGGTILGGGRSKRQWLTNASPRDYGDGGTFNGYARNMIRGYGITLKTGAELTVNGGYISGRGGAYQSSNKAAIAAGANTKITINDGYFKGQGCADVLQLNKTCDITVRAGIFETSDVDKIVWNRGSGGWMHQYYVNGFYGDVGIPDGVLDPQKQWILVGSEEYDPEDDSDDIETASTSKRICIEPYEDGEIQSGTINAGAGVTNSSDVDTGDGYGKWKPGTGGKLVANLTNGLYFPEGILNNDYMPQTSQQENAVYAWTISLSGKDVGYYYSISPEFELNGAVGKDGNPFVWETYKSYLISCKVQEYWNGCHVKVAIHGSAGYDYTDTYNINHDLGSFTLKTTTADYGQLALHNMLSITQNGVGNDAAQMYKNIDGVLFPTFEVKLNPVLRQLLDRWVDDRLIDNWVVYVTYYIYDHDTATGGYSMMTSFTSSGGENEAFTFTGTRTGLSNMRVTVTTNRTGGTAYENVHTVLEPVLVHSGITAQGKYKPMANYSQGFVYDPTVEYAGGNYVHLKAGYSRMTILGTNTAAGVTLDENNYYWQKLDEDTGNWVTLTGSEPGIAIDSVTPSILGTRVYGTYRACYDLNGTTYATPEATVFSDVDLDVYPLTVTAPETTKWENNSKLTIDLSGYDPDVTPAWSDNLGVSVNIISYPDGARFKKRSDRTTCTASGISVPINDFFNFSSLVPGTYTFKVSVEDKNTYVYDSDNPSIIRDLKSASAVVTVTYTYTATGADILVNGVNVTNGEESGSYTLPSKTKYITFKGQTAPTYATDPDMTYQWSLTGSNTDIASIDADSGRFTALKPGTCTVLMKAIENGSSQRVLYTRTCDVTIPIAGFTVEKPTLTKGMLVKDIKPTITAVWSWEGERQTANTGRWLTVNAESMIPTSGYYAGSRLSIKSTDTVDYNNTYKLVFAYKPTPGNQFILTAGDNEKFPDQQVPDLQCVAVNTFDSSGVGTDPGRGYWGEDTRSDGTYSPEWIDGTTDMAWLLYTYQFDRVQNPNATYIDVVSVILKEPAAGETAVQGGGTDSTDMKFLDGKVSSMVGVLDANGNPVLDYTSNVYYMNETAPVGSGIPYDDASAEDKLDNYLWYLDAYVYQCYQALSPEAKQEWLDNGWSVPEEKFYGRGLYFNDLNVKVMNKAADGTQYYISPDAKLFVNGMLVASTVAQGAETISAKYYFDVGEVYAYTGATIVGVKAPVAGEMPTTAEETTCVDDKGNPLPIYVSRLSWFVDANNNNKCDEGEEAIVRFDEEGNYDPTSYLEEDGSFKPYTTYKVQTELALSPEATGRFAPGVFETKINGVEAANRVMSGYNGSYPIASYKYAKTGVLAIDEIEFAVGKLEVGKAFPTPKTDESRIDWRFFWMVKDTGVSVGADAVVKAGTDYELYLRIKSNNQAYYPISEETVVTVNSSSTVFKSYTTEDQRYNFSYYVSTPAPAGVTVSGTATSFNSVTDDVTIQLIESGTSEAAYETIVKGNTANYSITGVASGTYTMKVMKKNHVTREYTVTVGGSNVTQDVKIHLKGDITGDGKVNTSDVNRANLQAKGKTTLSDYE